MEYLKEKPVAVLGAGAIGKDCAADCDLSGQGVRLFELEPYAKKNLFKLNQTGIKLYGIKTPIIDSMSTIASAMVGKDYFTEGYSLEYLGISHLNKDEIMGYLNEGVF